MFNFVQIKGLLQRVLDRMHSGAMIPLKLTSDKRKRQAQATSERAEGII